MYSDIEDLYNLIEDDNENYSLIGEEPIISTADYQINIGDHQTIRTNNLSLSRLEYT